MFGVCVCCVLACNVESPTSARRAFCISVKKEKKKRIPQSWSRHRICVIWRTSWKWPWTIYSSTSSRNDYLDFEHYYTYMNIDTDIVHILHVVSFRHAWQRFPAIHRCHPPLFSPWRRCCAQHVLGLFIAADADVLSDRRISQLDLRWFQI